MYIYTSVFVCTFFIYAEWNFSHFFLSWCYDSRGWRYMLSHTSYQTLEISKYSFNVFFMCTFIYDSALVSSPVSTFSKVIKEMFHAMIIEISLVAFVFFSFFLFFGIVHFCSSLMRTAYNRKLIPFKPTKNIYIPFLLSLLFCTSLLHWKIFEEKIWRERPPNWNEQKKHSSVFPNINTRLNYLKNFLFILFWRVFTVADFFKRFVSSTSPYIFFSMRVRIAYLCARYKHSDFFFIRIELKKILALCELFK